MLRGDSAFGTKKVIAACLEEGVEFSLSVSRNKRISQDNPQHQRRRLHPGALPRRGGLTLTPGR